VKLVIYNCLVIVMKIHNAVASSDTEWFYGVAYDGNGNSRFEQCWVMSTDRQQSVCVINDLSCISHMLC